MGQIWGPERIVTNGLVLSLDTADRNSYPGLADTIFDLSGNNYNGTVVNGPTINNLGITIDGLNDYVYITHNGALSFSSGNYTISVWNKDIVNPVSQYGGIITNDNTSDNAWKIFKDIGNNYYQARSNSTTVRFSDYTINKFHMYTYTFNSGNIFTYLDGVSTGFSASGASNPVSQNNIAFGSYRYQDAVNGSYLHNQTIGTVLLYNTTLSASEILQNYNAQKTRFGL
jgi:hypothetical protein